MVNHQVAKKQTAASLPTPFSVLSVVNLTS